MPADTPQIIIYSTSWCGFCHSEKQYLDRLGIPYIDKDVEQDEAAYTELMQKINGQYQGVPMTDIGGDMILGFDREAINEAIKRHGITPTEQPQAA
ncbi:MAG TPA: glutaredoxin domain-containing protein [Candidatus Saccharimonadales bacterium]